MNTQIMRVLRILMVFAALSGTDSHGADLAIPVAQGWNLLGNTGTSPIDVASVLGDSTKVTTVWKWNSQASAWVFYAPGLAANGKLASYASGKGFQVLASIAPGEGFWLNAAQPFILSRAGIVPYSFGRSALVQGWNLVATGDVLSPSQLDAKLGGVAGSPSFSTMWAWNSTSGSWYFYAPSLAASGGLPAHIQTNGYLDFGPLTTGNGLGFWLNSNVPAASSSDTLFTAPANPVNVTVATDATHAASQLVTAAGGGTINATGADGSQFTLNIPANALTQDTTITMTPITSIGGLPFANGLAAAVQFAPDGLFLQKDATLTIVPATSVPVINQTYFGYLGTGSDVHLAIPATTAAPIQLLVQHFSALGVANGTAPERTALRLKAAASEEARLTQSVATMLSEERQLQLLGVSDGTMTLANMPNYFDSFYKLVILPRIAVARASCVNATLALKTLLQWERNYQILGFPEHATFAADLSTVLAAKNATCVGLPNRYTGAFTVDYAPGLNSTGTVTFLRDDLACQAAGVYVANTACYRVESVSYTANDYMTMMGCKYSGSQTVQLSNTSVAYSNLSINVTPSTGPRSYVLVTSWTQNFPGALSVDCGVIKYTGDLVAAAALASDGTNRPTTDGQSVAGSFVTSKNIIFGWSLTAAP